MGWFKNLFKKELVCDCNNCTYTRRYGGYATCLKNNELPKDFIPPKPRPSSLPPPPPPPPLRVIIGDKLVIK